VAIDFPGPALRLRDLSGPVAVRFPFERLDQAHLRGVRLDGPVDLALQVIHPDGARIRSVLFGLRCAGPRERAGTVEGLEVPVRARLRGDVVPTLPPPPPAPRLGSGPYDVQVRFGVEGGSTRVHFQVLKSGGPSEPVFTTGDGLVLPGTEWNRGILLIWATSPLRRSTVALRTMVLQGRLAGPYLEAIPMDVEG